MTTLVTGGTGFLGQWLVQRLVERNEDVRVLARGYDPWVEDAGATLVEGSLLDTEDLGRALSDVTHVYHLAGRVTRDRRLAHRMYELHVDGTRRLLRAAAEADVEKIVLASTSGTVGVSRDDTFVATDDSPYAERTVKAWPYYLSKIYAERVADEVAAQTGLDIVQLRPTLLLGPGDHRESSTGDVVNFLLRRIPSTLSGGLSFVDARDAADAFVAAMDRAEPGSKYLLGGANMTLQSFFDNLEEISGVPAPSLPIPDNVAKIGARLLGGAMKWVGQTPDIDPASVEMATHYWYIDWSRAERDLGFTPRSPAETLRETVRWIQRHHPEFASTRPSPPQGTVRPETVAWTEGRNDR